MLDDIQRVILRGMKRSRALWIGIPVLLVLAAGIFIWTCGDIAPQDESDLVIDRRQVADDDNVLNLIEFTSDDVYSPSSRSTSRSCRRTLTTTSRSATRLKSERSCPKAGGLCSPTTSRRSAIPATIQPNSASTGELIRGRIPRPTSPPRQTADGEH